MVVYALDPDSPEKCAIARQLIREHRAQGLAVVSPQVLLDTYKVCTKKFEVPPHEAKREIEGLKSLQVIAPGIQEALDAIDISLQTQLSIFDAFILSSARLARCHIVYSEDMQDGFKIRGMTIVNPFRELAETK